jgi:hypothetical protein
MPVRIYLYRCTEEIKHHLVENLEVAPRLTPLLREDLRE